MPTTTSSTEKKNLIAISVVFLILGASFATWASRIPAIREIANLSPVTLGYVLLAKGVGTVFIMPVVAVTIERIGAKISSLLFGLFVILTLIPMTIAPNWETLAIVLFFAGVGAGGFNVSINSLASELEMSSGRSYMSLVHSFFGVGIFAGALMGTAMASIETSVSVHFWGMAALLLILLASSYMFLPTRDEDSASLKTGFKIPEGAVLWLGVICFLAASIEDSITNWVALFFTDYIGAGEGIASIGYAGYAGSMLVMRFLGDRLKPKFGAKALISGGSILATVGVVLAILSPGIVLAAVGFVAAGIGVALTFPMIFSAAGKQGAVALASVVTLGSIGGLVSQPLMGLLVEHFELTGGFLFIGLCMLAVGAASWKASLLSK